MVYKMAYLFLSIFFYYRYIGLQVQPIIYSVIQKDGLNFVHVYFLNYKWYLSDLHKI